MVHCTLFATIRIAANACTFFFVTRAQISLQYFFSVILNIKKKEKTSKQNIVFMSNAIHTVHTVTSFIE